MRAGTTATITPANARLAVCNFSAARGFYASYLVNAAVPETNPHASLTPIPRIRTIRSCLTLSVF
jgi:hypothetical protein